MNHIYIYQLKRILNFKNNKRIAIDFENGVAPVYKDKKCGLIDTNGKVIVPFEYDYLNTANEVVIENDLFSVEKDNKCGLINKNNEIITPIKYDSVWYIGEDLAEVGIRYVDENNENIWKFGIVNSKGEEILPIESDVFTYYKNGLLVSRKNDKFGAVDIDGNIVIPFEYYNIAYEEDKFDSSKSIMICANFDDNTISYLDKNGQMIKTEYDYHSYYVSDGLIIVEKGDKSGYVDFEFNTVIEPEYYTVNGFFEGISVVGNLSDKESGKVMYGYIDKTGELIVPMIYDTASNFENGQAIVSKDGNYYFISIDDESNKITPNISDVPKVVLNGELLEFPTDPVIIDGTTYVPIRKIAEGLGATVTFEPNTKNTLVELNGKVLSFNKNNNAIIKDSTMLIPVRYVSESFGAEVSWEQTTKTVNINQKYDVLLNNLNDEVFLYASSSEVDDGIYSSILVKTKDNEKYLIGKVQQMKLSIQKLNI